MKYLFYCLFAIFLPWQACSSQSVSKYPPPFETHSPQYTPSSEGKNTMHNNKECILHKEQPLSEIEHVVMPPVDVKSLLEGENQNPRKDEPIQFAYPIEVQIEPGKNGTWVALDNGVILWRLQIISADALSLNLGFTSYDMPVGGCLYVFTPDYKTVIGPFTDKDNEEHGQLWTPNLPGDAIIIEVSLPADVVSQLKLQLALVNHGYKEVLIPK